MAETELESESGVDTEVDNVTSEAADPGGTALENANDAEPQSSDEELLYEIDGEEVTLGQLREWKAGGLREADYTKKTEEVAKDRNEVQSQFAKVKSDREGLEARMEFMTQASEKFEKLILGDPVDESLIEDDPQEYQRQKARRDLRQDALGELVDELNQAQNDLNEDNANKLHTTLGWHDDEKKQSEIKLIDQFRKGDKDFPMSDKDFAKVTHPLLIKSLLLAQKYLDLQASSANKQVKKAPKAPSPDGAAKTEVKSLAERMYGKK